MIHLSSMLRLEKVVTLNIKNELFSSASEDHTIIESGDSVQWVVEV